MTNGMLHQILLALDHVHTQGTIHRDIKPENILFRGNNFFLTDFGIAKLVDTSRTFIGTQWYAAPEVVQRSKEHTPKVDIYSLGATVVECLVDLNEEAAKRGAWEENWQGWHKTLQLLLHDHARDYASMLADNADERPTARWLLEKLRSQPVHASSQTPQTNITWTGFGVSSPTNQADGMIVPYSAALTPMDWTQTVATDVFRGDPQPTQRDERPQPLQPNPAAIPSPKAPSNGPTQPGVRRGGSVRSVRSARSINGRRKKGHRRNESSENGRHGPSQSAGVPKRASSQKRRVRSKSIYST